MAKREYREDMLKSDDFADEELMNTGGELPSLSFTGGGSYTVTLGGGGIVSSSGGTSLAWPTAGISTVSSSSIYEAPTSTPIVKRYSMRDHILEVLAEVGVTEEDLVEASYIPPQLTITYVTGPSKTATITTEVLKSPF